MKHVFRLILLAALIFALPLSALASPDIEFAEVLYDEDTHTLTITVENCIPGFIELDGKLLVSVPHESEFDYETYTFSLPIYPSTGEHELIAYVERNGRRVAMDWAYFTVTRGFVTSTLNAITPSPAPIATPKPTATPKPAATPKPTATPKPLVVKKVNLNVSGTVALNIGETLELTASVTPDGAVTDFIWSSSKNSVATVSGGIVSAISEGKAKITVQSANKKKATVTVQVTDPTKPISIRFADKSFSMNKGEIIPLQPEFTPETANRTLQWKSSKPKVAQVDNAGNVTAISKGSATITATTPNKKKATIKVTVADPYEPLSVKLVAEESTVGIGSTLVLTPVLTPNTAISDSYTWKSSKPKIATVDNGIVHGMSTGKAKITVTTANNKKATYTVQVIQATTVQKERLDLITYMGEDLLKTANELNLKPIDYGEIGGWETEYGNDCFQFGIDIDSSMDDPLLIGFVSLNKDPEAKYSVDGVWIGMSLEDGQKRLAANGWTLDSHDSKNRVMVYRRDHLSLTLTYGSTITWIHAATIVEL